MRKPNFGGGISVSYCLSTHPASLFLFFFLSLLRPVSASPLIKLFPQSSSLCSICSHQHWKVEVGAVSGPPLNLCLLVPHPVLLWAWPLFLLLGFIIPSSVVTVPDGVKIFFFFFLQTSSAQLTLLSLLYLLLRFTLTITCRMTLNRSWAGFVFILRRVKSK